MTKTALVSGGAGFIGSAVVRRLLDAGWRVVVLDDLSTGRAENMAEVPGVTFRQADVRDRAEVESAMQGVDVAFHLAAEVGNLRSIEDPVEDATTNLIGTIVLFEAARQAGVKRVVVSSSAAIFGELLHLPIREDHPLNPDSPYGVSKLAEEKVALCYGRMYDLTVVALRYFNVYGRRQHFDAYGNVIPIFFERLMKPEPLTIYGDGLQTRDFVNVRDVAEANFLAGTVARESGAYNIASGESVTILELVELIREVTGRPVEARHAPRRVGDVLHSKADISAARDAFGFDPRVPLREGLAEYWAWKQTVR